MTKRVCWTCGEEFITHCEEIVDCEKCWDKAAPTIYIKPMTWAGDTKFYVGHEPSKPKADPGHRLGAYFLVCRSLREARAVAAAYASRVVECDHYVGL